MRNILVLLVLAGLAWYGYGKYQVAHSVAPEPATTCNGHPPLELPATSVNAESTSKCDGRTMCSQMTSCAEATYFIQHCPTPRWTATTMEFLVSVSGATDKV